MRVQLPQIPFLKTFAVGLKMSARELFGLVHRKWIQVSLADKDFVLRQVAEDYVFKVCGLREYLYGDGELLTYDCVWRAISSGDRLSLLLVHRAALGRPSDEGVSNAGCSVLDLVWPRPSPTTAAERVTRDGVPSDGPTAGVMGAPPGASEPNQALRVTLRTASGLSQAEAGLFSVALTLSHGMESLESRQLSQLVAMEGAASWDVACEMGEISVGMRLNIAVYDESIDDGGSSPGKAQPAHAHAARLHCVGWASLSLFDELGAAKNGLHELRLWQDATAPDAAIAPCTSNLHDDAPVRLSVQLDCSPHSPRLMVDDGEAVAVDRAPLIALAEGFTKLLKAPDEAESRLLWSNRAALAVEVRFLPLLALCVPRRHGGCAAARRDLAAMLAGAAPLPMWAALQLIGPQYRYDTVVSANACWG